MDDQVRELGVDAERGNVVARRSEENHMDPCFRFPFDELKELFDGASLVESMLIALEHMQVNFVTVSRTGLRKFRRNTISFPQDFAAFARRQALMKHYRPGDRVNSSRGAGRDLKRPVRRAVDCDAEERKRYGVDRDGALVIAATVRERLRDGTLVLDYDDGGEGLELSEHVTSRVVMPWHPQDVPLHLMLRRNIGYGRDPLEGLQVRWSYVANLLQALCAFARKGLPWRLGGSEEEPMHKYYDPAMFDMLDEKQIKERYAPKLCEGEVLDATAAAAAAAVGGAGGEAIDLTTAQHFIAAGFDVNFVGPEGDATAGTEDAGGDALHVGVETFARWLDLSELRIGTLLARWWTNEMPCEEGDPDGLKGGADETTVDLFERLRCDTRTKWEQLGEKWDGIVRLSDVVEWFERRVGPSLGLDDVESSEMLVDQILHELTIVSSFNGALGDDRGCMEEPLNPRDDEGDAVKVAERLVHGWPNKDAEPTGAMTVGRFVKAHPLDFPMGIADLYEERPHKVSVSEWVQHLLRYWTGHFVGGLRGQRVVWSMVNVLLLSEARSRGFGIYRNVMRRVGLGLEGGRVLTKGRLREILASENSSRVLVSQLSTVGRDVRSTPMQWAYEGKKCDATVKHMSWVPPWVASRTGEDPPLGTRYLGPETRADVPDRVGLGRFSSVWWTLNCKYNAAYDVQRMNSKCKRASDAIDERVEACKEERFLFTRDSPDLVAFQLTLRAELLMQIVMPAVVPHSEELPFKAMARFETSDEGGHPHFHGFNMGLPAPVMSRVRADIEGDGDEPPDSLAADVSAVRAIFDKGGCDFQIPELELRQRIKSLLKRDDGEEGGADATDGESGSDAGSGRDHAVRAATVRVNEALLGLVELGIAEVVDSGELGVEDRIYRTVPVVPRCPDVEAAVGARRSRDGRPVGVRDQEGAGHHMSGPLEDSGVFTERNADVRLQSDLENAFADFFGGMVSEWNPCFSETGDLRYKWDEEIGAHDVELDIDADDASLTSEQKAVRDVESRWPERMNLRSMLDKVFGPGDADADDVDIQRVRRMVAALVQRVERHTLHGLARPTPGVHPCARGKEKCPVCRYGFPHERFERGGRRRMQLVKGDREGQWHAHFPRNDRLCCSHEAHVLLANMGNVDWRPCLNLWAVVQYITKYATKAPKGSRRLAEVLKDAVDEVCKYVPEGDGTDLLRRSIQKFFAHMMGERDFHAYEAVQLGLQLPLVIPFMPVVSLNTSGSRPLKAGKFLKDASEGTPVHWDSRVDKFDKRLQLVRRTKGEDVGRWEKEVRDLSLYEFWWKYCVFKGTLKEGATDVCIMVTPSYSADCANVEHPCHDSYARAAVVAYWRLMATSQRHTEIAKVMATSVESVDRKFWGGSVFEHPLPHAGAEASDLDRYLGVRDLYEKFEGKIGWGMAMMEMLVDPMLLTWVPAWVVEQYERANPFFRDVLKRMDARRLDCDNAALLRRTRREMIKRHQRLLKKADKKADDKDSDSNGGSGGGSEPSGDGDVDPDLDGKDLAAAQAEAELDDGSGGVVSMLRDPRPEPGAGGVGTEADKDWRRADPAELLSAAGRAAPTVDRVAGAAERPGEGSRSRRFGVLHNPKDWPWTLEKCNVHWSEHARLEKLRVEMYGMDVGDGADKVTREELDPWQKFAYDIVCGVKRKPTEALRLMLLGSAGTGKSRTVRSFVGGVRERLLGEFGAELEKHRERLRKATCAKQREAATVELEAVLEKIRNACILAAPTGCASFQLKFGAATIHRVFGIGIHGCGPWTNRQDKRFLKVRTRMTQAKLFVMDELSMIGRCMMGKIEFKVRDVLGDMRAPDGSDIFLGGRDAVLSGDPKQADPIGDEPMHKEGAYTGRGVNKPKGASETPAGWLKTDTLVNLGIALRNQFEDVVYLREVHRISEDNDEVPVEKKDEYRRDADEFLKVTRGMADCTWTRQQHMWLSRRNRSVLQQTAEGRRELEKFADAPVLMDGRKDRVTDEVGANRVNLMRLEELSDRTGKPIACLCAFHDKPDTVEGQKILPEGMDAESFRGMEAELQMCEGARVLLTQNLWVEAGLMNGALGYLRGYMWPEGGDPHAKEKAKQAPLCVFIEFDSVNLGVDENGEPRSFFPDDPPATEPGSRRNWVPIFRQKVSSNLEDKVAREQYPLTLAWALTHWKAQGMTLERVRVHLSERTAAVAGIGFVATTRVRHPWHLVFEEDLPEYSQWMKASKTPGFRSRRRFELRQEARASRTLRKYGFCEADLWNPDERKAAELLLEGLKVTAAQQRARLRATGRFLDSDSWLWPEGEPDFEGELASVVLGLAKGDAERRVFLERVSERLLDRTRRRCGSLPGEVTEEPLPEELKPLHMSAVREALGALIPDRLHKSYDKSVQRGKENFGEVRSGSFLRMDGWRVNVRSEDALSKGRLDEEALEFFLLLLQRVSRELNLPVAIGSKTVGKAAGVSDTPETFARVMARWRKVWNAAEVKDKEELLLPVAVDERTPPHDWVFVSVRSCVAGELLGDARRLRVQVCDPVRRPGVAERIARNLDVLLRGIGARIDGGSAKIEVVSGPECRVSTQRLVGAFGMLVCRVAVLGGEKALNEASNSFVPDFCNALHAVFVYFRTELAERGLQDACDVLKGEESCRKVLRMFAEVPELTPPRAGVAPGVCRVQGEGVGAGAGQRSSLDQVLRVASWNIAGGHRSAEAPESWSLQDQRVAVLAEILRWDEASKCDVVALQECEDKEGYKELLKLYVFVGSVEATASRGYVHLYVRRGIEYEVCEVQGGKPCVVARLLVAAGEGRDAQRVVVAAVHLPTGDSFGVRKACLRAARAVPGGDGGALVIIGDMNAKDDEVDSLCKALSLDEARYAGVSWGFTGNKFYADSQYRGLGIRYDRLLFGGKVWAEAHLLGRGRRFFDGSSGRSFYLSDHLALMGFVDLHEVYGSHQRSAELAARARRGQLVAMKDVSAQKESVEARVKFQLGVEEQEAARRRASVRDRAEFCRQQQKAARGRAERRSRLRVEAFGPKSFFDDGVLPVPALTDGVPSAPSDVFIGSLAAVPKGGWSRTVDLPLRGLIRTSNTCYVNSVTQLLMRIPAMAEWMSEHTKTCERHADCLLCALHDTSVQVLTGVVWADAPILAERRAQVSHEFAGVDQHDIFEFLEKFMSCVRGDEIVAGRCGVWGRVQIDAPVATHMDRIFGFVRETRRRCKGCGERACVRAWYSCERVWRVVPAKLDGGPLTVAEMYLASCAPSSELKLCEICKSDTEHVSQSRIMTAPNVLLLQVKRAPGELRLPVDIEEQVDLPGLPPMVLAGIVYHDGHSVKTGHYTCVCRGPRGGYWYYDDSRPVVRMEKDVAQIKPREVYLLAYCLADGTADWASVNPATVVEVVADDSVTAAAAAAAGVGGAVSAAAFAGCGVSGGVRGSQSSRLGAATSGVKGTCSAPTPDLASPVRRRLAEKKSRGSSPLIRDATTPERAAKAKRLTEGASEAFVEHVLCDSVELMEGVEADHSCGVTIVGAQGSSTCGHGVPAPSVKETCSGLTPELGSPVRRRLTGKKSREISPLIRDATTLERAAKAMRLTVGATSGEVVDVIFCDAPGLTLGVESGDASAHSRRAVSVDLTCGRESFRSEVADAEVPENRSELGELAPPVDLFGMDELDLSCATRDDAAEGRPLGSLFAKYPKLRCVPDVSVKLDTWIRDPSLAFAYVEKAEREGWPDLLATTPVVRSRVPLEATAIGSALQRGTGGVGVISSRTRGMKKGRECGEAGDTETTAVRTGGVEEQEAVEKEEVFDAEQGAEGWKRFTPDVLNAAKCQARTWCSGRGGQCSKKPAAIGGDFCSGHMARDKWREHGRVDGPISEVKWKDFVKSERRSRATGRVGCEGAAAPAACAVGSEVLLAVDAPVVAGAAVARDDVSREIVGAAPPRGGGRGQGTRGRMTDLSGADLDCGAGGAFSAGRK